MDMNQIAGMTHQELMTCVGDRKSAILKKLQSGETELSFSIGAKSFTVKEWDKLLSKVDQNNEAIRKEQEERKEALEKEALEKKESEQKMFISILETGNVKRNYFMEKIKGTYQPSCPYESLAKNGVIHYKGVEFVCDTERNAICLGDMSNKKDVLTIPLEGGGSLMVNRDSIGLLSKAMSMFSPEDRNRIMRAIADDNKIQEMQQEIDEDTNSIGDDAENKLE